MRVLFTCIPGKAHFHALLSLVLAVRDAGHEVAVATAATFGAAFADAGVPVLPSGVDWSQSDPTSLPEFHQAQGPPIGAFAAVAGRGMVEDLIEHASSFKPDLIIWDAMEFGGWIAAELLGIPQASFASAMGTPRPIIASLTGEILGELPTRYGLEPDPELRRMFSHLYLHRKPRTLDLPYGEKLPREFRYRPEMFDAAPPPAPDWLDELDDRPLVHLSLGTTFVGTSTATAVQRTVLAALADEPVNVVVSTGGTAVAEFGTVPDNARLVPYVDHRALLPRCALFLSHGSFSSILVAIANEVPMCFLPLSADQPVVSMHLANLGLGVNLANAARGPVPTVDGAALRPADVLAATRRVLSDSGYRRAVASVRRDFLRLPPITEVVPAVERLVEG